MIAIALRYVVALAALAVFLFPLYWMAATALKPRDEILTYPPHWWPQAPVLENVMALIGGDAAAAFVNSLMVAAASTLIAVTLGTTGGYALTRSRLGGRLLAGWGMAARMAPPVAIAVPFVLLLALAGDIDRAGGRVASLALLVAITAAFNLPYVVWMMRGYFRDVPVALEEMALVAGMSRDEVRRKVVWPMVRGGFVATAAFTFLMAWNELVFALLLTPERTSTFAALLARTGPEPERWAGAAALGVAGFLPVLVALALMGRRLGRSLSLGVVGT